MNDSCIKRRRMNIKNVYSFTFIFSFILNGYSSGIPGISLGALALSLFGFISILYMLSGKIILFGRQKIFVSPIIIIMMMLFQSLIVVLIFSSDKFEMNSMIIEFVKLALWAVIISITTYYFLDYSRLYKWIVKISLISTVYLFLQNIFWYGIGYRLPSILNLAFIKPYHEGYIHEIGRVQYTYAYFRPSSFFSEPAFYSNIVLCALAMILFGNNLKLSKKSWYVSIFLSTGILLATSTSGIYLLFLLWIYYLAKKVKLKKKIILLFISIIFFIIIILISSKIQFQNFDFGMFGDTIQYTLEKPFNSSNSARVGRSYSYLGSVEGVHTFIGIGMGNVGYFMGERDVYMNSLTAFLFQYGYIGLISFMAFMFSLFKGKKDELSNILLFFYILKIFSSGIMFNMFGILYLSIIVLRKKYTATKELYERC